MTLKVQLNHPGGQKSFKLNKGYTEIEGKIIREQNIDGEHYRKFIKNSGYYLNNLGDAISDKTDLFFWGEWEGRSYFEPNNNFLVVRGLSTTALFVSRFHQFFLIIN